MNFQYGFKKIENGIEPIGSGTSNVSVTVELSLRDYIFTKEVNQQVILDVRKLDIKVGEKIAIIGEFHQESQLLLRYYVAS